MARDRSSSSAHPLMPMRYTFKQSPYSSHGKIVSLLGRGGGRTCVDVGCASGYLARQLSRAGWRVLGVEPDPEAARAAREHCEQVLEMDLDSVDLRSIGAFQAIVFGDVLEHLPAPSQTLSRSIEHLDPDGVVVISVPNIANLLIRVNLLFGRFDYTERGILDKTHLRFYTRRSLRRLIEDCGLEIEHMTPTPLPIEEAIPVARHFGELSALADAFTRLLPTVLGYQFVVRARRASRV